jgi:hypothetical protein
MKSSFAGITWAAIFLCILTVQHSSAFLSSNLPFIGPAQARHISTPVFLEAGSTAERPLYDGTNYTFPDTTTPAGVAELLEVSFVNACMQLSTGYVDVLKMFIAAAMAGFELGLPLDSIQQELSVCKKQTAGRPLMPEEEELRHLWYCLVYSTLASLGHPTRIAAVVESIPDEILSEYGPLIDTVVQAHKDDKSMSVEEVMKFNKAGLTEMEQALRAQSFRVVTTTFDVLTESAEARPGAAQPPPPPIPGAFE